MTPIPSPDHENERRSADWDLRLGPRNFLALISTQCSSAALAFAAVWVITRQIGVEGYGILVAVLVAAQLPGQLAINWTLSAVSRFGAEEFVERGTLAATFWTRFAILVPNVAAVLLVSGLWMPPVARWLRLPESLLPLVALLLVAGAFWLHVQHALQAAKLPRLLGYLLALERLLIAMLVLLLSATDQASIASVAAAFLVAPLAVSLLGLWRLRYLIAPAFSFERRRLDSVLRFSLPLVPYAIVGYFTTSQLDALLVSRLLSTESLGLYGVAVQLSGLLMQPPILAGSLLMPLFVTLQSTDRQTVLPRLFGEVLPLVVLAWSLACVTAGLAAEALLPLLLGEPFRESARAFWPLLAASSVASASLIGYAPLATARSLTSIGSISAICAALLNVGLDLLLIPHYGIVGCAWATFAAYSASTALGAWLVVWRASGITPWAFLASLPAVAAAGVELWWGSPARTVLVTLAVTLLLILMGRRQLRAGVSAFQTRMPLSY